MSVPDNSVDEPDGWQYIYLQGSGGGVDPEARPDRVGFYFRDNDEPVAQTVTLSASPNPVGEGSKVTITAKLSVDPSADVTIPLTIPAPGGGEYTVPTNAEITITGTGTDRKARWIFRRMKIQIRWMSRSRWSLLRRHGLAVRLERGRSVLGGDHDL